MPADLLARADKILTQLENQGTESPPPMRQTSAVTEQISLFDRAEEHPILAELAKLDVYNMTPMQVMNVLVELKQKL
ncbi:DNA mismatch repair protein MutS [Streptococcus pneumoniae]|nr:DNA mismatch repair protein MutS [Streptococcus pneumoniae]CIW37273.1 DNA mismatch repair protein MutS [Streptococcus pneumoniae]COE87421.1 DNA mismatch repair protein MutS [Streptococcus pneumoniae]